MTKLDFQGRIIMVGCGGVGQAVLPVLERHIADLHGRLLVIAADESGRMVAERHGAQFLHGLLTPGNYRNLLKPHVKEGDLLLNLSIDISSLDLIRFCSSRGALYVDTSIEPWPGIFDNPMLKLHQRTNFAIRNKMLDVARELGSDSPTAVVDHGANPGMVSHFLKQAILDLARHIKQSDFTPKSREEWAALARDLNITTIQVSERDTQVSERPKRQGEFVNTWSVSGIIDELMQPAEIAIGTAEKQFPREAREHRSGSSTVYLRRPCCSTFALSWTPSIGGFQGMLVTHDEIFSMADYLSISENGRFTYRPSAMFVYHPCDDAMLSSLELEGNGWNPQPVLRLMRKEIVSGMDELGVLVAGHERNGYWFGSQLTIDYARSIVPETNATIMQVVAGAISAIHWAILNPRRGVVEPEDMDHEVCLDVAKPYLGQLVGEFTDWTPLDGRGKYFPEKLDVERPWQLQNIRSRQWFGA